MIRIYKDTSGEFIPDEYGVVAEYDPEAQTWTSDEVGYADIYPDGTDPAVILQQVDGPQFVAVDESEASDGVQKTLTGDTVGSGVSKGDGPRVYVDSVHDAPDGAVVRCDPDDEADDRLYYEQ